MGLYLKISIALFILFVLVIYFIIFNLKNKRRYLKLYFSIGSLTVLLISIVISNLILLNLEKKHKILYDNIEDVEIRGIVDSDIIKNEFNYSFELKVIDINSEKKFKSTRLVIQTKNITSIEYGNIVRIKGKFSKIQAYKNSYVFNYRNYLKKYNIYGNVKANYIEVENKTNNIFVLRQKVRKTMIDKIQILLKKDEASLLIGILLGDTNNISESILEDFRISNISHILAVSGAHVSCIILGISFIVTKIVNDSKLKKILIILGLIIFAFLVGFSPSIIRATFMCIMILTGKLFYRKSNTYVNMAISFLIVLIYNPYYIQDTGCLLSYTGTLGILLWVEKIEKFVKNKSKIIKYILSIIIVTLSVNIMIIPIIASSYNKISLNFFISNLLISPLIFITEILGFLTILTPIFISKILSIPLVCILKLLILISKVCSKLPLSQITVPTPSIIIICFYYIIIFLLNKRIEGNKIKKEKLLIFVMIIVLIVNSIYIFSNEKLKIFFIDVGQGDGYLISTPLRKNILIDGGGNENYDIGKNILIKYLLGKKIMKLDYIIITHFDFDHCGGAFYVMENLKVSNVIIPIQFEESENFKKFRDIVNNKNINVIQVKMGDRLFFDKYTYMDVLWPTSNKVNENILNNNSLVAKICYKNFSMLITGDIEQIAEKEILKKYSSNILKSTILKVPHHGSSSSSTKELLKKVNPQIALIGVGENNLYGHPSIDVIKRLESSGAMIFRTDIDGEITIVIDNRGRIRTKKYVD